MFIKQKIKRKIFLFLFFLFFVITPLFIYGGVLFFQLNPVYAAQKIEINAEELISLTNQTREKYGLHPLQKNEKLTRAALNKAKDILENDYFAHTSPRGITPWYWIEKEEYDYMYAGENLALGFLTSLAAHQAWLNSPTHRENILGCHYKEIGIAVMVGEFKGSTTTIAVQMFGARDNQYKKCEENFKSPAEEEITFTLSPADSTPPLVPQFLTPSKNLITNQTTLAFKIRTEPFAEIILYQNGKAVHQGKTNREGEVKWKVSGFKDGEYFFQARSRDAAGNLSKLSRPLKIIIDTKPPQVNQSSSFITLAPQDPLNKFLVKIKTEDEDVIKALLFTEDRIYELEKTKQGFQITIPQTNGLLLASLQDQAGNVTDFKLNFLNSISSVEKTRESPFKQIITGLTKIYKFSAILGMVIFSLLFFGSLIIKLTLRHPKEAILGVWLLSLLEKIKK